MIVTCGECSTSFQLDESRIPESGARVRCSRCKHAFFLAHPSASRDAAVHSIAEDAAGDANAGLPPASNDLAGLDGSIASQANPPEPMPEPDDEEDWQFTEEVRVEGDDPETADDFGTGTDFSQDFDEVALSGDDGALGADGQLEIGGPGDAAAGPGAAELGVDDDASGLDLAGDVGTLGGDDELGVDRGIEAGHDDSGFGAVEDFSALDEDAGVEGASLDTSLNADLSDDSDAGLYSAGGATEDLGDPESWDLTPDADFDSPKASIAGLVDAFSSPSSGRGQAAGLGLGGDLDPSQYDAELAEPSKLGAVARTVGRAAGWAITIVVVGVVGHASLAPEWNRWDVKHRSIVAVAGVEAETTATRWVETARVGPVLVIDGIARNGGRAAVRPSPLQIALLDAEGQALPGTSIAVGGPLRERTLREGTAAQISRAMSSGRDQFLNRPLAPGERRPFQAVLSELPESARRFVLEVAPAQSVRTRATPPTASETGTRAQEPQVDLGTTSDSASDDAAGKKGLKAGADPANADSAQPAEGMAERAASAAQGSERSP